MFRYQLSALSLLAAFLFTASAVAEDYPAAVKSLLKQPGIEVLDNFQAPGGMTAYIVSVRGKPNVIYLTPDKKYAFIGIMVNEDGENLTAGQMEEHLPKPDYAAIWQRFEKAAWVAEGAKDPKSVVYVFADPYCPYCHAFWKASQPYLAAGLQLRWVFVSYLKPDGEAKIASILEAKDPAAALTRHESSFDKGGIAPLEKPKPKTLEAIRANGQLMRDLGINGTPALVYRDADGTVHLASGMPKLGALPTIFNLPEQTIDDPGLARFR